MNGSIVYTNTGITSTDGIISINHHTSSIHITNLSASTNAVIKLNGTHEVIIPHTPTTATGCYICIPGDYTKIEVITASVTIGVIAVG